MSPKHRELDTVGLKELVRAQVEQLKTKGALSFSAIHDSTLLNLLDLCRDPYFALTTLKTKCDKFGKDRILKAVSYGGPYSEDPVFFLSNFSMKYFRKLSKYDLLKKFLVAGNLESANWYVTFNTENWTNEEVIDIVEVMGLSFPIGKELLRRGMASQALTYALNSGDTQTAIDVSSEMLKTPVAAEENIIKVIAVWREKRPDMMTSPKALLMFAKNPSHETYEEVTALMMSFGPIVSAFLQIHPFGANGDESVLRVITQYHHELRRNIKSCVSEKTLSIKDSDVKNAQNDHLDSSSATQEREVPSVAVNATVIQNFRMPSEKKLKKVKNKKH